MTSECSTDRDYFANFKNSEAEKSSNILHDADEITMGDRERDYDHPKPNHERIARLWNAYLASRRHGRIEEIDPEDVCYMMILVKMSRDIYHPKRDNLIDIAGYARCIERMRDEMPTRIPPDA